MAKKTAEQIEAETLRTDIAEFLEKLNLADLQISMIFIARLAREDADDTDIVTEDKEADSDADAAPADDWDDEPAAADADADDLITADSDADADEWGDAPAATSSDSDGDAAAQFEQPVRRTSRTTESVGRRQRVEEPAPAPAPKKTNKPAPAPEPEARTRASNISAPSDKIPLPIESYRGKPAKEISDVLRLIGIKKDIIPDRNNAQDMYKALSKIIKKANESSKDELVAMGAKKGVAINFGAGRKDDPLKCRIALVTLINNKVMGWPGGK